MGVCGLGGGGKGGTGVLRGIGVSVERGVLVGVTVTAEGTGAADVLNTVRTSRKNAKKAATDATLQAMSSERGRRIKETSPLPSAVQN
jgi:hypothetical protein